MAPPKSVQALQGYLEREKPEFEVVSALGVPEDWLIVRLVDCASLSEEQRILPDGEKGARPRPRAIRFVGEGRFDVATAGCTYLMTSPSSS